MKREWIVAAIMVTVLFITSACSLVFGASLPKEASIQVTDDEFMGNNHITKVIEVPDGGVLTVTLGSNPATGFNWTRAPRIENEAILQQTENKLLLPEGKGIVGSSGSQVWIFRALQKGTTTINMEYSQPWEGGEKAEWTLELIVNVK
jgi:inhibitor of cysteine peptidase